MIQDTLHQEPRPKEKNLGTFFFSDLVQEDQDMLSDWEGVRQMHKEIEGVRFTVIVNMDSEA